MKITNNHGISLPVAVWLLHDDYDYIDEPNYISATSLLKSTRQIVLSKRVPAAAKSVDVSDFISARFGHAVHDSVETAWRLSGSTAMKRLGYPDNIADNLIINPIDPELATKMGQIPVHIEQRAFREINGYKIGGKFDMVIQGRLFDFKTTSVWTWMKGNKDEDYSLQGSIYRWLNPDLVTDPNIYIQFLFTDWQRRESLRSKDYPAIRSKEHVVPLKSLEETEHFIKNKLQELSRFWNSPDEELPQCTDKELWRGPTTYKYYANAANTSGRATKNFDSMADAQLFKSSKGGQGTIIGVAGEVRACDYCPAFSICKQKDQYYA